MLFNNSIMYSSTNDMTQRKLYNIYTKKKKYYFSGLIESDDRTCVYKRLKKKPG